MVIFMTNIFKTYGDFFRTVGPVLFFVGIISWILINIFPNQVYLKPNLFILCHYLTLLIPLGIILFFSHRFLYHVDYHTEDFDFFTTKIHNSFENPWEKEHCSHENYEEMKFSASGRVKRVIQIKDRRISNIYVERTIRTKTGRDYFKIYYLFFNSEKERAENEERLVKKYREMHDNCHTGHYSAENILIVFQCYTFSIYGIKRAYPFTKYLVIRKAVKNIKLRSLTELQEIMVKKEKEQKAQLINISKDSSLDISRRKSAISLIDDNSILADIALNDSDSEASLEAARKITDNTLLTDILINTDYSNMAELIDHIDDKEMLFKIAHYAKEQTVKIRSKDKIRDRGLWDKFQAYEKKQYLICKKCGGKYSIVGSHYNKQFDWFFYDLKCDGCGDVADIPQHMLDE